MAINEQASRDATSKAPVLVYSVNQGGWPALSPIAPPPPPRYQRDACHGTNPVLKSTANFSHGARFVFLYRFRFSS